LHVWPLETHRGDRAEQLGKVDGGGNHGPGGKDQLGCSGYGGKS